jgi:hypothetical protein
LIHWLSLKEQRGIVSWRQIFTGLCREKKAELSGFTLIGSLTRMQGSIVQAQAHWKFCNKRG